MINRNPSLPNCPLDKAPKTHLAAGVIAYRPQLLSHTSGEVSRPHFLLLKNSLGWEFPKGIIEEGETELEAAKRELKEEAGLHDFVVESSFKYISKYFITKNYETGEKLLIAEPKVVTYFLAVVAPSPKVTLSFEHSDYGWFIPNEANKKLHFSKKQEALQEAINFIKNESK